MRTLFFSLLLAAVGSLALSAMQAPLASAQDDYWTNHWNWYDNTYSPYQRRYYSNNGTGNYGYSNYTNNRMFAYPNNGYRNYPNSYYGVPNTSYYPNYTSGYYGTYPAYGGGAVQVGPVTFGWR